MMSWAFGVIWIVASVVLWWKLSFDGAAPPLITDLSVFGQQSILIDLVAAGAALISGLVFIKSIILKSTDSKKQLALIVLGLGVVLCASVNQFWYFSISIFLFLISNLIFFEEINLRNLLSLATLSVVGVAIEAYFATAPQPVLLIFFILFVIVAFRIFPNGVVDSKAKEQGSSLASWIFKEAPAMSVGFFYMRRSGLILEEQSAFLLKLIVIVLSCLNWLRSFRLSDRRLQEQSFLSSVALISIYSTNLQGAQVWGPSMLLSLSLIYFVCRACVGDYDRMKWIGLLAIVLSASPFFVFSHTLMASLSSEEFIKNMVLSLALLSLAGFHLGTAAAAAIEGVSDRSIPKGVTWTTIFLLLLLSLQFFWSGVGFYDKDISQLTNEGAWAPLSIFVATAATSLMAHRAIKRILEDFWKGLDFQDKIWTQTVDFVSKKANGFLARLEKTVIRRGIAETLGHVLRAVSLAWSSTEVKVHKRISTFTGSLALKSASWWQEKQTTDAQYYLIFGIGTVALLLLHFLINAQL